jgi:creatinine deaminase
MQVSYRGCGARPDSASCTTQGYGRHAHRRQGCGGNRAPAWIDVIAGSGVPAFEAVSGRRVERATLAGFLPWRWGGTGYRCTVNDLEYLELAKSEARLGRSEGGIPIGAALVAEDGVVLGVGRNRRVQEGSAIRHGEMDALERAGRLPATTYARSTMYTTLSPCSMCTGAILLYGISRVVIGEHRTFTGDEELLRSRGVEVVVLDDAECASMMQDFITSESALWNEDIGESDLSG